MFCAGSCFCKNDRFGSFGKITVFAFADFYHKEQENGEQL